MNAFKIAMIIEVTIWFIPGIYLRYSPFRNVITGKQKKTLVISYLIMLLLNILLMGVVQMFFSENVTISSWFIICDYTMVGVVGALMNILIIRGHMKEHLFIYGVVTLINYMTLSLAAFIVVYIPKLKLMEKYMISSLLFILLLLLSFYPIRIILKKTVEPFLAIGDESYWNRIWFIPVGMFFSMVFAKPFWEMAMTWSQLVSQILMLFVTLLVCYNVMADYRVLAEKRAVEEQLDMSKTHYAELQSRVEQARRTRHDLKHILAAIRYYIDTDDKSGLADFCNDMEKRNNYEPAIPYTGNAAVDGVLYHYMLKSKENNIQFSYKGVIKNQGIADLDLCVILGNALDNAIAGCMTIEDNRKITVVAQSEEHLLSIVFNNTFDGKVEIKDDVVISRKRKNAIPGIGIASMEEICLRYGGTLDTQWDDKSFTGLILLPIH